MTCIDIKDRFIAPTGEFAEDSRGDVKHERSRCRWNLLWIIFLVFIVPMGLWLGWVSELAQSVFEQSISWFGVLLIVITSVNVIRNIFKMKNAMEIDWLAERTPVSDKTPKQIDVETPETNGFGLQAKNIIHVVVMNAYREPLEVISKSINSIANQTVAYNIIMVLGFEAGTPDIDNKAAVLYDTFASKFLQFHISAHPKKWSGEREISGKCSNANYAQRAIVSYLNDNPIPYHSMNDMTLTSVDSDTVFPIRYFEKLAFDFVTLPVARNAVWQAPLVYNYKLTERPFFVRCIAIFRSAFMLGLFIPFSINPMSVYSTSLELSIKSRFTHPAYQMDDLTTFITMTSVSKHRIPILMIPMPVLNGPTSGESYIVECKEWFIQGERWTIGAAEVFHYICVKCRTLPIASRFEFLIVFSLYYGFILCSMTLTTFLALFGDLITNATLPNSSTQGNLALFSGLFSLVVSYVMYIVFFWMDSSYVKILEHYKMIPCGEERAGLIKNIFHWLMMWPTLLLYSLVEYFALWEITIFGKSVCGHNPSSKDSLQTKSTDHSVSVDVSNTETGLDEDSEHSCQTKAQYGSTSIDLNESIPYPQLFDQ